MKLGYDSTFVSTKPLTEERSTNSPSSYGSSLGSVLGLGAGAFGRGAGTLGLGAGGLGYHFGGPGQHEAAEQCCSLPSTECRKSDRCLNLCYWLLGLMLMVALGIGSAWM